jgi:hypothetical protein
MISEYFVVIKMYFLFKADGIALGAAAATSKTNVEIIVFMAIMLHKVKHFFKL